MVPIPGRAHPRRAVGYRGNRRQHRKVRESLDILDRLERCVHLFYQENGGQPKPQTCQKTHEDEPLALRAVRDGRQFGRLDDLVRNVLIAFLHALVQLLRLLLGQHGLVLRARERRIPHALGNCRLQTGRRVHPVFIIRHLGCQRAALLLVALRALIDRRQFGLQCDIAHVESRRLASRPQRGSERFQVPNFLFGSQDLRILRGVPGLELSQLEP